LDETMQKQPGRATIAVAKRDTNGSVGKTSPSVIALSEERVVTESRRIRQPLEAAQDDDALLQVSTACMLGGFSSPTFYRRAASDPSFPKLIRLSTRCTRVRAGSFRAWLVKQAAE
jgi:predicted DNA-binding transcriptional regulator AlpA